MSRKPGPHALTFIFVTVLLDTIGFGIILPVTPQLIMDLTGEGVGQASIYGGWLAFAYAVAQFFCGPVIGNLSDRFGRRPVLLASLAAFGIDYILMGVAPTAFAAAFNRASSRPVMATRDPASTRAFAIARPIPLDPPVTSAVRFLRFISSSTLP